jgi:hypothetical protein
MTLWATGRYRYRYSRVTRSLRFGLDRFLVALGLFAPVTTAK